MKDQKRFRGCLVAGAAGDALGYPVEFMGERAIFARYGRPGIQEYELVCGKAQISDDTQMTLFTATGLLLGGTRLTEGDLGGMSPGCVWDSYRDWLRTQTGSPFRAGELHSSWLSNVPALWSRRAPGNTCLGSLMGGRMGSLKHPTNDSRGCGGVMRVAPVGLYLPHLEDFTQDETDLFAAETAALTHGSDLAYMPAAMLAHIVSLASQNSGISILTIVEDAIAAVKRLFAEEKHIDQFVSLMETAVKLARSGTDDLTAIHSLGEGWYGDEALAIAVFCVLRYSDDLEKALITAVNHRGDSDSTGAIAGNILGAYLGMDAVPDKFIRNLELLDVILEVADDLYRDAAGGYSENMELWLSKYRHMTYSGPGNGE